MVMEKSLNMQNCPKVMEFCSSVLKFYQFCHRIVQNLYVFFPPLKLSIHLESQHFQVFSVKCSECKIEKRDGHGKLRNGH